MSKMDKQKEIMTNLIDTIDLVLEENFCKSCRFQHVRAIPDECNDCVAGIPLSFNYEYKEFKE